MKRLTLFIALMALCLGAPSWAQDRSAAPKKAPAPDVRPQARRRALLEKRVGLDAAKAAAVERIVKKHAPTQRAARQKMRAARQKLRGLLRADSGDQQAYQAALDEMESAQRALIEVRRKRFEELKAALTPKEQAKLLAAMNQVHKELRKPKKERKSKRKRRQPAGGELKDPFGKW